MTTIFLSHSHEDKAIASELSEELKKCGLDVWLDGEQAIAGESITSAISEAISKSDAVIALLTKKSQESTWLSSEVAAAIAKSKKVIPVLSDSDVQVPLVLHDRLWLTLNESGGAHRAAIQIAKSVKSFTDPEQELKNRSEQLAIQKAEMKREYELAKVLHEKRENELRTRSFTVMFVLTCAVGAGLFYLLDEGTSAFSFLWLAIGILIGAGTVQIGNFLRIKNESNQLDREAEK